MIAYNKLVRDKIPEIIKDKDGVCTYHTASDIEFHQKLSEKLEEEVREFIASETIDEAADILEVLYSFGVMHGYTLDQIEAKRLQKREAKGGFENKIVLEEASEM
jgi:predicted house-cleaning noncanonical NTP pyrophosphatase (MazG superfamily)